MLLYNDDELAQWTMLDADAARWEIYTQFWCPTIVVIIKFREISLPIGRDDNRRSESCEPDNPFIFSHQQPQSSRKGR